MVTPSTCQLSANSFQQFTRVFDKYYTLSQTGPIQPCTAPPVIQAVCHWANQLNFTVYWLQSWVGAEKWSRSHGDLGHFVFTLCQWSAILPYQIPPIDVTGLWPFLREKQSYLCKSYRIQLEKSVWPSRMLLWNRCEIQSIQEVAVIVGLR